MAVVTRLQEVTVLPPNPDVLRIVSLHLERLPIMSDKERELFFEILEHIVRPPCINIWSPAE